MENVNNEDRTFIPPSKVTEESKVSTHLLLIKREGRGYRNAEGSHSFLPAIVPRDGPSGWTGLSSKNLLVARLLVLYSVWHREEPEVHNSLLQEWFATGPCVLCGRVCPGPGNSDCH